MKGAGVVGRGTGPSRVSARSGTGVVAVGIARGVVLGGGLGGGNWGGLFPVRTQGLPVLCAGDWCVGFSVGLGLGVGAYGECV